MPEVEETEFEVWFMDECVAITCGEDAEAEAMNYARVYEEEPSPFHAFVYKVTKTRELIR